MKKLIATLAALSSFALVVLGDEPVAGWTSLFNGTNLDGWVKMNNCSFIATNGVLHLAGGQGWLRTEREFTNFILEVEWRARETNYNSGVFLRAATNGRPFPTNVWQVNLKATALGELIQGAKKMVTTVIPPQPVGGWVKFRMEVRSYQVALDVDGVRLWEFAEITPERGVIGLQAESRAFDFRNLRIRELTAE